jgi:hypothetical protein
MDQQFLDGLVDLASEIDRMVLIDMVKAGGELLGCERPEQLDSFRFIVPPVLLEEAKSYLQLACN